MPSPNLRKAALAVLLTCAVLCLTFPFYTHSITLTRAIVVREEYGPRFFAMDPPEFADKAFSGYTKRHRDHWQINWIRTIHGYLLLSSVSLAAGWLGIAIVGRKNTRNPPLR